MGKIFVYFANDLAFKEFNFEKKFTFSDSFSSSSSSSLDSFCFRCLKRNWKEIEKKLKRNWKEIKTKKKWKKWNSKNY